MRTFQIKFIHKNESFHSSNISNERKENRDCVILEHVNLYSTTYSNSSFGCRHTYQSDLASLCLASFMCCQGKIQQRYTAHWQRPLQCLEESWLLWISCLFNQGGKVSAPEVEYICIKILLPWLDPPVSDSSVSSLLKLYRCEQNQGCVDFSTLLHMV